jgi:putative hydrolase of the HAD superfamily
LKLIAWDFDGVLNRGYPHGFDEWQRTFEVDLGVSAKDFTDFVYTERNFVTVLTGQIDLMDLMADYVATHDVPHAPRAVLDYWLNKDANPDLQVLGWLQACTLPGVIATNNETHRADHIWHAMGFSRHFDHIFASGRMGVKKPDAGFFEQIESWSGHAPEDILLIDDAEKNIQAAQARGWQVFHFTDSSRARLPQVLGLTP